MKKISLILLMMISSLCFGQTTEADYLQLENQRLLRVQSHEVAIQNYISQNINSFTLPLPVANKINATKDEKGNSLSTADLNVEILKAKNLALRREYFTLNSNIINDYQALSLPASLPCINNGFENGDTSGFTFFRLPFDGIGGNPSWKIFENFPANGDGSIGATNGYISLVEPGNDPIINTLPKVKDGNYAIKLNIPDGGYDVSLMRREIPVTQSSISFNYALVLQDPGNSHIVADSNHPGQFINQKPYYQCRLKTLIGNNLIFERKIVADINNVDVFSTLANTNYVYTNWVCENIDVTQFLGQTLVLELIVGDCGQSAHFGYAYFDNFCGVKCSAPTFGKVTLNTMGVTCPLLPLSVSGSFIAPTGYELDKLTLKAKNISTGVIEYTSPQGQYNLFGNDFNFTVKGDNLFPSGISNKQFDFFVTATFKLIGGTSTLDVESQSANDGPDSVFNTDCKICNSCAPPSSTYYFKGFWPAGTHGQGGYVIYINEFGNTETVIIGHAEDPCQGIAGVVSIVQKVGVVSCDQ